MGMGEEVIRAGNVTLQSDNAAQTVKSTEVTVKLCEYIQDRQASRITALLDCDVDTDAPYKGWDPGSERALH